MRSILSCILCLAMVAPCMAGGDQIRVAVASNFASTLAELVKQYELTTTQRVTLIPGSTGKHYAQIRSGAPFDAFFAADEARPRLLEQQGKSLTGSRFTYARGRLVLWGRSLDSQMSIHEALQQESLHHLAMANPVLAPYGAAAQQTLVKLGHWSHVQQKLVLGENIAQAYQFVHSGNAELGLVALAQVSQAGHSPSDWISIPGTTHAPIEQQAVLLTETAREFLVFVRTDAARLTIQRHGYDLP